MTLETFDFITLAQLSNLATVIWLMPALTGIIVVLANLAATWSDTNINMVVLSTKEMGQPQQLEFSFHDPVQAEIEFFGYSLKQLEEAMECAHNLFVHRAHQTPSIAPATVECDAPMLNLLEDMWYQDLIEAATTSSSRTRIFLQLLELLEDKEVLEYKH